MSSGAPGAAHGEIGGGEQAGSLRYGRLEACGTKEEWAEAERRAACCRKYLEFRAAGWNGQQAARLVGVSQARFSGAESWLARFEAGGVAALVDRKPDAMAVACDRAESLGMTPAQVARASARMRALYLASNWQSERGSLNDAASRYASEAECPPRLRELIAERLQKGRCPLPEWLAREVRSAAPFVRAARAPRDAQLVHACAPGSIQLERDEVTGEDRRIDPGEYWTLDDGTLNFVATVPLEVRGNKCFDRFGVLVGRFQLLLLADHASYFLPGFSYTARPLSSYRAEDLLATMHAAMTEHGAPKGMILEKGISKANAITSALEGIGCEIIRANTPHQKVVEFVFGWLWTKLSHIPGSVGRFGGDEVEINALIQACRDGRTDPRELFWPMTKVVGAIREAVAGWNGHTVHSQLYGHWRPAELWRQRAAANLRPMEAGSAWLFAPFTSQPLVVRSACVQCTVPMMEGVSTKFAFHCARLMEVYGARVQLHFNPFSADPTATITLAEAANGFRAGTVLGTGTQISRWCAHTRRAFGYGDDADLGKLKRSEMGQQLRRAVVTIRADGAAGHQVAEARDGEGNASRIETLKPGQPAETSVERPQARPAAVAKRAARNVFMEMLVGE